ncbi:MULTISPECIES: hypothetical protein [Thermoprotei]
MQELVKLNQKLLEETTRVELLRKTTKQRNEASGQKRVTLDRFTWK